MKLYHLSRLSKRDSILQEGLIPQSKCTGTIQYENRLFLFSDLNEIPFDYVSYSEVDVWEIELPEGVELHKDNNGDPGQFYIDRPVDKVKLIKKF